VKRGPKPGKKSLSFEETLRKRLQGIYKAVYEYTVSIYSTSFFNCDSLLEINFSHQIDMRPLREIFMTLPSKKDYPDYYKVISEPIDMTIIDGKIKGGMVSITYYSH
jgi:hypothetical protein